MASIRTRQGGTRPATINKNQYVSLGFMPTSIPGCQLWLDSTDSSSITFSSGNNVGQWRDKSGAGNHFGTVAGTVTRITDGSFSVINIASGGIMSSANQITFTTSSAFYIVSKITGVVNWGNMLLAFPNIASGGGSTGDFSIRFEDFILRGTRGNGNGQDFANGTYYVNGNFNPSFVSNVYLNVYSMIGTVSPQSGGTSQVTLSSGFMGRNFVGNIAEFLYYPGGINSIQRQNIESYLAQKWGLTASLPAGHLHLIQPVILNSQPATNAGFIKRGPAILSLGSFQFTTTPSQFLSIPNNTAFTQNTAFTYELWYYPTNTNTGYLVSMLQQNWLTVQWSRHGAGTIGVDMSYVGNPPGYVRQNRTYAINRWHHIALTWNGTNGVLYINGVSEAVFTGAGAIVNAGNRLYIGQYQDQNLPTPLGYLTNFRWVKGVSVYTGEFTPPTRPLTVTQSAGTNISAITAGQTQLLILANDSLLTDSSTNNFTITNNGSVAWTALTPFS